MASTVAWIWLVAMLGSKMYTFGPKFGSSPDALGAPGWAAGIAACAAPAGATGKRTRPANEHKIMMRASRRGRMPDGSALLNRTFMVTPSSTYAGSNRGARQAYLADTRAARRWPRPGGPGSRTRGRRPVASWWAMRDRALRTGPTPPSRRAAGR